MAYICEKPSGSCPDCEHYRYDADHGGMACWAEHDKKNGTPGAVSLKERKRREELFKLMQENPDLPVVAMVDSEIVADDGYARWIGSWGCSYIGEYFKGEERLHFREDDDPYEIEEALTDGEINYDDFEAMSDEDAQAAYASLPWVKAIIVNIDLPD